MFVVVGLVVTIIVGLITWYLKEESKYKEFISRYPGPKGVPIIGIAPEIKNSEDLLQTLHKYAREYGSLYQVKIGMRHLLICSDEKFLEFLLTSTKLIDKSVDYKTLMDWFGDGLLTASGKKWSVFRKIITPTFHFEILEPFVETFNTSVDILIKKLEKEVDHDRTNIYPYITLCTLDSICETAMGTSVDAQEDPESAYVRSVKEMSRILIDRSFSAWKQFDFLFQFSNDYIRSQECIKILHTFSNNVIKRKKDELLKTKNVKDSHEVDEFGKKKKMAFLDLLLKSTINGEPLSDLDIRQEVDTFMFEGHDTTASAVSFALFCIANNPQVQEKIMEELLDIYGYDLSRQATYKDVQNMKYLELVVKEALRMFPSVPIFGRQLTEDVEYNGTILPANLTVTVLVYSVHMNPKIYPDPELFNPDRFLPENQRKRNFYDYIPFSAGPRNCIGQKFAMMEMKALLSKILRNYELFPVQPEHKLILAAETILKSYSGIQIKIRKRVYEK